MDGPSKDSKRTGKDKIKHRAYRHELGSNGIKLLQGSQKPPPHITTLLNAILPVEPVTFIPNDDERLMLRDIAIEGVNEDRVRVYLESRLGSLTKDSRLQLWSNELLNGLRVPCRHVDRRLVIPKPDCYLGYRALGFDSDVLDIVCELDTHNAKFPFLEMEYKGDGTFGAGGLWVAINQCMGGTATFLNILDGLKSKLLGKNFTQMADSLEPIMFSLVTNGTEARLFVTYSNGGNYSMFLIRGFLLYEDSGMEKLATYLRYIINWGSSSRLEKIDDALRALHKSGERGLEAATSTIPGRNDEENGGSNNPTYESMHTSYSEEEVTTSSQPNSHSTRGWLMASPPPYERGQRKYERDYRINWRNLE